MPQTPDLQNILQQFQQHLGSLQKQAMRTRQVALASQGEIALLRAGRSSRFPVEFTAQFGEDIFAWQLLGYPLEGFFIEAGAFDGYHYSVSHGLEALGWTGLLVEPLPAPAEKCRARRTGSRVVQTALSTDGAVGPATFTVTEDHYGGMLSYFKATDSHVAETNWAKKTTIDVPVTSLNALLASHTGPIDFMSIDVEGGEIDVMQGFDIERFKPRIIMLEENTNGRDPALTNYLAKFPYELVTRLAVNCVYVRREEKEIFDRLHWMKMG